MFTSLLNCHWEVFWLDICQHSTKTFLTNQEFHVLNIRQVILSKQYINFIAQCFFKVIIFTLQVLILANLIKQPWKGEGVNLLLI